MLSRITSNTRNRVDRHSQRWLVVAASFIFVYGMSATFAVAQGSPANIMLASASASQSGSQKNDDSEEELSPEQKMARRFPQPVRVGFLVGLPVLDGDDSTIGYIADVVRTKGGKIVLIVPYYSWFGWIQNGGIADRWRKPVAVPIETVAILARQVNALDISRDDFDDAPSFDKAGANSINPDEQISIALGRR